MRNLMEQITRSNHNRPFACVLALILTCQIGSESTRAQEKPAEKQLIATVNNHEITNGDLEFWRILHGQSNQLLSSTQRKQAIEQLISQQLISDFLQQRKLKADNFLIEQHQQRIENMIEKRGSKPAEVFEKLGLSADDLKQAIAFQVIWQKYCQLAITDVKIRKHFAEYKQQYDGTKLRASQILIILPRPDDQEAQHDAKLTLAEARELITSGELSFADAARKYSRAPSRLKGGDVGWFPYRGKMPLSFTQVAFALDANEVSQVVQSPFGFHLIKVTDRKPGGLSLEDCRSIIYRDLCQELYVKTAADLRKAARIKYASSNPDQ